MKPIFTAIVLCFLLLCIHGCALIITGPKQRVYLYSSEPSTEVYINGQLKDTTPCEIKVRRSWGNPPEIEMRKKGFVTQNVYLRKRFNEISTLNFLLLINWGIDLATGAVWRYQQPDTIQLIPKKKSH